MQTYKGFSTVNRNFSNTFSLTGFELVRQDLINHFSIRKGEKLQNPAFGTVIWDVMHNPLTPDQITVLEEDVRSVISYDPRVESERIVVDQHDHGLIIEMTLRYIPDQSTENLLFNFDADAGTVSATSQ